MNESEGKGHCGHMNKGLHSYMTSLERESETSSLRAQNEKEIRKFVKETYTFEDEIIL